MTCNADKDEGEAIDWSLSGGWEIRIRKGKVLLKLNPVRDDVEKKALNFIGDERSRLSLYVVWCADLVMYWY